MARLRVRVELNRGGVGVPLHKLASVVHEAQRFFEMLAEDVHIAQNSGEWLGFDFDNESLNFTAEFVGPVAQDQAQAFYAAFDGITSLRRGTIAQFTQITDAIGEDELIGFGLYPSDHETEPSEWRCLSRRDALRIADEIQHLLGVAGEMHKETHLPAIAESEAASRLFRERAHRAVAIADQSKLPDLVREVESSLSKRIARLEDDVENHSQSIRELRETSAATEESFKGLLNAVENFCGQATRQLERLSPAGELPAPVPVPITAPAPAAVSTPIPDAVSAAVPAPAGLSISAAAAFEPPAEPMPPARSGRSWRAFAIACVILLALITAGLVWWPSRSADQSGSQAAGSGAPSSVIASSQPTPSPETPQSAVTPTDSSTDKPSPAPAQPPPPKEKAAPVPSHTQPAKPASAVSDLVIAKPEPSSSLSAAQTASASEAGADVMRVEMEAQEPVWVMVTDNQGKILIARTLQANEIRSLDLTNSATLRTGNAGGLRVRLNGKDLGPLGPTGKIRDVQFKDGAFKVTAPDAG